jgi:hypothetical protein
MLMTFTPLYRFFLVVLLCATAVGCGRKAEDAPATVKPTATPTAAPAPAATEQSASAKLQGYIECYNEIDGNAHRTISRYASWVKDMKAGPTGNERVVYGLYQINSENIAKCQKVFAQTAAAKPSLAKLDTAGTAYIAALVAMDKLVADAYTYYDRENYKDDKFAKGRSLHVPLAASFDAFKQASNAFSDALEVENDTLLNAQLAEIEKTQGRKLAYFQMALMNKAKLLVRTIGEEEFDAAKAGEQLGTYEKITDEAMSYAKAQPNEVPTSWSSLQNSSEEFRKAAKERVRRLRDKVPYNDGEKMMLKPGSGWMVEGSVEKTVKAYNELVSASNSL